MSVKYIHIVNRDRRITTVVSKIPRAKRYDSMSAYRLRHVVWTNWRLGKQRPSLSSNLWRINKPKLVRYYCYLPQRARCWGETVSKYCQKDVIILQFFDTPFDNTWQCWVPFQGAQVLYTTRMQEASSPLHLVKIGNILYPQFWRNKN